MGGSNCIEMPAGWHRNGKLTMPLLPPLVPPAGITNQSQYSFYLNWDVASGFFPAWTSRQQLISYSGHVQGHLYALPGADGLCWGGEGRASMDGFISADTAKASLPIFSEMNQKLQRIVKVLRSKTPEYGRVTTTPLDKLRFPGVRRGRSEVWFPLGERWGHCSKPFSEG